MTCTTLKNPGARVNAPCGGRRDPDALEADSPAFHKLCSASWAVQLARSVITNKSIPFGAVVVYAAACAWRDRGPALGDLNDEGNPVRNAAATPPGGWPALVGVTPHTWRKWRAYAVSANLIEILSAGPLLRPVAKIEDSEQWARVEIAVLFHRNLSQRARRAFVALSLFRQSNDFVSVSIRKIGAHAGLERRHVQRALRELESIGALQPAGVRRYRVIKAALPGNSSRPQTGNSSRPFKSLRQESLPRINIKNHVRPDSARQAARPDTGPIDFTQFQNAYPKRSGSQPWKRAVKAAEARIKEGAQFSAMIDGARRYAEFCDAEGKAGTQFVMQAATFLGPERHYLEAWDPPLSKADALYQRNRQAAADWLESDASDAVLFNPPGDPERIMPAAAVVATTPPPPPPPPVETPESCLAKQKEDAAKVAETIDTLDGADDRLSRSLAKFGRTMLAAKVA